MAIPDPAWQRWPEVDRLFAAALDLPEQRREPFVIERCGDDLELREAVLSLLRAARDSRGLLERPDPETAHEAVAALASLSPAAEPEPTTIGPYRIVRQLARGGMGTVYLADRVGEDFEQRVALKLLRRGIDTDDVVRRFLVERRILASLVHPNIARLLDGGSTADGRPFLAMEYVDGTPITEYCDAARSDISARLRLFLHVADAVSYAHAKLVVHRDLKPSNILVTREERVKLLDFGIAKILSGETDAGDRPALTRTGSRVLTPEYASPEQLRGEPITTASDVFQLGVLLFLLLTGRRPFPRSRGRAVAAGGEEATTLRPSVAVAGKDAAAEAIHRSTTPERLRRRLRGDLDTIVSKALRDEPERRYASVGHLADDVRRHLEGRPVAARPDTLLYRAGKFLGRHRWLGPTVGAAILFLTLYVATSLRYTARLQEERNVARQQAARAEEVQKFLVDLFRSPDPFSPADPDRGKKITVVQALDIGAKRVSSELAGRPGVEARLLDAIARVYSDLNANERALSLSRRALALHTQVDGPASEAYRQALGNVAQNEDVVGQTDSALTLFQRRLRLTEADPAASVAERAEARAELALHFAMHEVGRPADAERELRRALALADSASLPPAQVWIVERGLAGVMQDLGKPQAAIAPARAAVRLASAAFGPASASAGIAHEVLARALDGAGRTNDAAREFGRAKTILETVFGPDSPNTLNAWNNRALFRRRHGDLAGAERDLRGIMAARIRTGATATLAMADVYQNLGVVLRGLGKLEEAAQMHRKAGTMYQRLLKPDNFRRAYPYLSLSAVQLELGRPDSAEASARTALSVLRRALPPGHYATAVARCQLGRALLGAGRVDSALAELRPAVGVIRKGTQTPPEYRAQCIAALDSATARRQSLDQGGAAPLPPSLR